VKRQTEELLQAIRELVVSHYTWQLPDTKSEDHTNVRT